MIYATIFGAVKEQLGFAEMSLVQAKRRRLERGQGFGSSVKFCNPDSNCCRVEHRPELSMMTHPTALQIEHQCMNYVPIQHSVGGCHWLAPIAAQNAVGCELQCLLFTARTIEQATAYDCYAALKPRSFINKAIAARLVAKQFHS